MAAVYERHDDGWQRVANIAPPGVGAASASSLALSDRWLAIGDAAAGAVHVYARDQGTYRLVQAIDFATEEGVGSVGLAIADDVIAVGQAGHGAIPSSASVQGAIALYRIHASEVP